MIENSIDVASFETDCLRVIEEINISKRSVIITRDGRPVATLSPARPAKTTTSIIGSMKGSVLRYDQPFDSVFEQSI